MYSFRTMSEKKWFQMTTELCYVKMKSASIYLFDEWLYNHLMSEY